MDIPFNGSIVGCFRYSSGKNVTLIMPDNPILELCSEEFNSMAHQIKYLKFINVHDMKSQC